MEQLTEWVVPVDASVAQETHKDDRSFFEKAWDTLWEYVDQGIDFVKNVSNQFTKLDSWEDYSLDQSTEYNKLIVEEANKTSLDRVVDSVWDFFNKALEMPNILLNEWEDSFMKKFTWTDVFKSSQSAETANEIIKNFYNRDDVINEKDPNKLASLQEDLYNKIRPLIKPEKQQSDLDIQNAMKELSIFKQIERQQKDIESDRLNYLIQKDVQDVVNKKYVWWTWFYNQWLIEKFKQNAAQELNEVYQMKKDLQISALELWINKEEANERIAKLDKIIEVKKKQIDNALKAAYTDEDAFKEDTTWRLNIYNKAFEWIWNDEVNLLLDYERNNTKDINTLLNVNRLNQLKKWWVADRLWAWLSWIQWTFWLVFDSLDTALWIKPVASWIVWRNYSSDNRESMLNALQSDENYLSVANRTWAAYVLQTALYNFDDIWQVVLWWWIMNKATWINKVVRMLDKVDWKVATALATWAKWLIESYAYNNQLSMAANELNTDDYQMMNAILDPFAENVINFASYAIWNKVADFWWKYTSMNETRAFQTYMEKNWVPEFKKMDTEKVQDMLRWTKLLLNNNIQWRWMTSSAEKLRESIKWIHEQIKNTWSYQYNWDWLIITEYTNSIRKATSPTYLFNNITNILNKPQDKYLNDLLKWYIEQPKQFTKSLKWKDLINVQSSISKIQSLYKSYNWTTDQLIKNDLLNKMQIEWVNINWTLKSNIPSEISRVKVFDLNTMTETTAEINLESSKIKINWINWDRWMLQDSIYTWSNADKWLELNKLLSSDWLTITWKIDESNIKTKVADIVNLDEDDFNLWLFWLDIIQKQNWATVKIVPLKEWIDVQSLKLVSKWMWRTEILNLLINGKWFYEELKNAQDYESILMGILPVIDWTVITNKTSLNDFREASRLFIKSTIATWLFKELWWNNSTNLNALSNILIQAAVKWEDNELLVWKIMRLDNSTLWNVSRAELIASIFTWSVNNILQSPEDYFKIFNSVWVDMKDLSKFVWFDMKYYTKKIQSIVKRIEKYDKNAWEIFKQQFLTQNRIVSNAIMHESVTSDIYKAMNKDYKSILTTYNEIKSANNNTIKKIKELYWLDKWITSINTILRELKRKVEELKISKWDKELISKIENEIDKIQNSWVDISYKKELQDIVTRVKISNDMQSLLETKAQIIDTIKSMNESNWLLVEDKSIKEYLKQYQIAYINKHTEITWATTNKNVIDYVDKLYTVIEWMNNNSKSYIWYVKDNLEDIWNYWDEPHINTIANLFLFTPTGQRTYPDLIQSSYKKLKEKWLDLEFIKNQSIDDTDLQIRLNNTDIGRDMSAIWWIYDNLIIEPVSIFWLSNKLNDPKLSLTDRYKISNWYILNIQKYLISKWMYNDEYKTALEIVQAKYILEATRWFIDTTDDIVNWVKLAESFFKKALTWNKSQILDDLIQWISKLTSTTLTGTIKWDTLKKSFNDWINRLLNISDFDKSQSLLNKTLLENTPFNQMLKSLWLSYNNIIWWLLEHVKNIEIWKKIKLEETNAYKDIYKIWSKTIWDINTNKYVQDLISLIIKDWTYKDLISSKLNLLWENLADDFKYQLNNILLEVIMEKSPDFLFKNIKIQDWNSIKESIKWFSAEAQIATFSNILFYISKIDDKTISDLEKIIIKYWVSTKEELGLFKEELNRTNQLNNKKLFTSYIENIYLDQKWKAKILKENEKEEYDKILYDTLFKEYDELFKNIDSYTTLKYDLSKAPNPDNAINIINELYDNITEEIKKDNVEFDKEDGSKISLIEILENNKVAIMENTINKIREKNSSIFRDVTILNWYSQNKKTSLTEHSDWINKVLNMKTIIDLWAAIKWKAKSIVWIDSMKNIFKYDKVEQIEYSESFFKYLAKDTDLEKNQVQSMYVVINNLNYIKKKRWLWKLLYNEVEWKDFWMNETITKNKFDEIVEKSWDNYIWIPTFWEEANKWFFVNPSAEIIDKVIWDELSKQWWKEYKSWKKSYYEINKELDNIIFEDLRWVLWIEETDKLKFSKRLKQSLAWWNWLLDKEEKVLSFSLQDTTLWNFYDLTTFFKTEWLELSENDEKRLMSILKAEDKDFTDKEIDWIISNIWKENVWQLDIPDTIKTIKDLKWKDIDNIYNSFISDLDNSDLIFKSEIKKWIEEKFKLFELNKDYSKENISELIDILDSWKTEIKNQVSSLYKIPTLNKSKIDNIEKFVFPYLEKVKNELLSIKETDAIIKWTTWVDLKSLLQSNSWSSKRNLLIYAMSKNNDKIKRLIRTWMIDSNAEMTYLNLLDLDWDSLFKVIWEYLNKESFDWMWYMSKSLAEKYFESRTWLKYKAEYRDSLKDLKAHILWDWVLEKTRQEVLSYEMQSIFDKEIKRLAKESWFEYNPNYTISFESWIKLGKKPKEWKFKKLNWNEILNQWVKTKLLWYREISSNDIKIAASNAITDKETQTISMQYLAWQDSVMNQAIQNLSIAWKVNKVNSDKNRIKVNRSLSDNKWHHNKETLNEYVNESEKELFNLLKWISDDGWSLKLSWWEMYKDKQWNRNKLEDDTFYISEYKYNQLLEHWSLIKIWLESDWKTPIYWALWFRNPVAWPYNISLWKIKIDYSAHWKNLKIHPSDTFLKKEWDFDADTVVLLTPSKWWYVYKSLFISALKQTSVNYEHNIDYITANWDIIVLEKVLDEKYNEATELVTSQINNWTFYNKYIPTEQAWESWDPLMKKSEFSSTTLQWATIESSVAKEKIWTVSVSQEWIYYIRNSLEEYSKTNNEVLWNVSVWYLTIFELSKMIDLTNRKFFSKFASILQWTLDFAKATDRFDEKWLEKQIEPMLKDLPNKKENLQSIITNIEEFAKWIKRFKNLDSTEFLNLPIVQLYLPPVMNNRYTKIQRAMKDIQSLRTNEEWIELWLRDLYVRKINWIEWYKDNIQSIINYFDWLLDKDWRKDLVNKLASKNLRTINNFFDLDNLHTNKDVYWMQTIKFLPWEHKDQIEMLTDFVKLRSPWKDRNVWISEVMKWEQKSFDVVITKDKWVEFTFDPNVYTKSDLLNKYADLLEYQDINTQILDSLALKIMWYKKASHLFDEARRTEEVLTNINVLKSLSLKTRSDVLSWIDLEKKNLLKDIWIKFDSDDYKFVTDLVETKDFNEFLENYKMEFSKVWNIFEASIYEKDVVEKEIDKIVKEVKIKNNISNAVLDLYNNESIDVKSKNRLTSLHIDAEWNIINWNNIESPTIEATSNLTNIFTTLMNVNWDSLYREAIMKTTYWLSPLNAISTIKELEDIVYTLADNYSLSIWSKLAKFAPDIATRFHSIRDNIRSNDLKILLDNVLTLRKDYQWKISEYYINNIENHLFQNLANWKEWSYVSFVPKDSTDSSIEWIEQNFNAYQKELKSILETSNLNNLINIAKYNTNKLKKATDTSNLINFLEIQNWKLEWVLAEFWIYTKDWLIDHINKHKINEWRTLNTAEIENMVKEIFDLNNKHWFWKFLRLVKSNMYTLAFSPILVPAALAVTLLQMVPDFFINISKKSKSFDNPRVNQLLKDYNILDSEVLNYVNNIHEAMDISVTQKPIRWLWNIVRSASDNPTYKKTVSSIELMLSNWFAINDVLLWPLRRKTAATRAFDTIAEAVWWVDAFFMKYWDDPEQLAKAMDLVRLQAHTQFQDLSWWSSTARLMQTTVFSSWYHNLWNFMQTWSTSMVSQHITASSHFYWMTKALLSKDKDKAKLHFKAFSEYLSWQLKMNLSIAYVLAKYQMVYNENEWQDWEYDIWTYIKTLNNTIAWLESFSPIWAWRWFIERFDINQWWLYNMAMLSQEVTWRFGREFNLPKNITNYVINATKSWVTWEQILDWVYDILSDRTNWFIRYNKFEMEDWYSQDTYTTNLFGIATWVWDLTSYQKFKEDMRKYWSQRAFQELSTHWLLATIFWSNWYWKMISSLYSNDSSFALYEQMVKEIYELRWNDDILKELISTWMNPDILNKIMMKWDSLNKATVDELFNAMTWYSARWLWEFINSDSWITWFQFNSYDKWANVIDNLVMSQLNEKYWKWIVDAIIQNDFWTISKFVQAKVWPEMLNNLYNTWSQEVDEAKLRKMLLIASEKTELSIPTLVSTMIWDKAYEFEKKWLDKTSARYLAIQTYWSLANWNLWAVNDVANIYTKEKYWDKLKALFNPQFKKQFSNSLENKLLIDMAVWRAFYEEWDIESAELRWDMTAILNNTYKNMKDKTDWVLSKEDASKLMLDYEYINAELSKLNWKVDPLKLYHYREWVMLSILQKPDLLSEVENNIDFVKQFSDVKDNLTLRFLKFAWEKKAYDLEWFEDLVKTKYNQKIWLKSSWWSWWSFNSFRPSSKPFTKWWSNWFNNWSWTPFVNRAIDRWINTNNQPIQLLQNSPFPWASYWPKMYNEWIKQWINKLYKEYYQQYSKDLVKRNPEYINRTLYSKKQMAEMIWMQSRFWRKDFKFIPKTPYSKLSKWLIPWWAYNKE